MGHRKGDPRPDSEVQATPEEIARAVEFQMELDRQVPVNKFDENAVYERYMWYLDTCLAYTMKPTVEGLACAIGVDRVTLRRWKDGEVKSIPEPVRLILKRAWAALNNLLIIYTNEGKLNPIPAIVQLKNNHGYKDQTETVVVKRDPYETGSPEEIAQRYLAGVAPALDVPQEIARENAPVVETVVVDQTGKVE